MNEENPRPPESPEPSSASSSEIRPDSQKPPFQEFPQEKEIDLNELYPDSESDLNVLFPEEEMKYFLKKVLKILLAQRYLPLKQLEQVSSWITESLGSRDALPSHAHKSSS